MASKPNPLEQLGREMGSPMLPLSQRGDVLQRLNLLQGPSPSMMGAMGPNMGAPSPAPAQAPAQGGRGGALNLLQALTQGLSVAFSRQPAEQLLSQLQEQRRSALEKERFEQEKQIQEKRDQDAREFQKELMREQHKQQSIWKAEERIDRRESEEGARQQAVRMAEIQQNYQLDLTRTVHELKEGTLAQEWARQDARERASTILNLGASLDGDIGTVMRVYDDTMNGRVPPQEVMNKFSRAVTSTRGAASREAYNKTLLAAREQLFSMVYKARMASVTDPLTGRLMPGVDLSTIMADTIKDISTMPVEEVITGVLKGLPEGGERSWGELTTSEQIAIQEQEKAVFLQHLQIARTEKERNLIKNERRRELEAKGVPADVTKYILGESGIPGEEAGEGFGEWLNRVFGSQQQQRREVGGSIYEGIARDPLLGR